MYPIKIYKKGVKRLQMSLTRFTSVFALYQPCADKSNNYPRFSTSSHFIPPNPKHRKTHNIIILFRLYSSKLTTYITTYASYNS